MPLTTCLRDAICTMVSIRSLLSQSYYFKKRYGSPLSSISKIRIVSALMTMMLLRLWKTGNALCFFLSFLLVGFAAIPLSVNISILCRTYPDNVVDESRPDVGDVVAIYKYQKNVTLICMGGKVMSICKYLSVVFYLIEDKIF